MKSMIKLFAIVFLILLCFMLSVVVCASADSVSGADLFVGYNASYTFYISVTDQESYNLMRIDKEGNEMSLLQASLLTNIQFCDDEFVYVAAVDPTCDDEHDPLYTQGLRVSCIDGNVEVLPLEQYSRSVYKQFLCGAFSLLRLRDLSVSS